MDKPPLKIFAYGTLMRGYQYHESMKACRFLGVGKTAGKYAMFVQDYPFITSQPHSHSTHIMGELYEVPDLETLVRLDEIEGHPHDYERRAVLVTMRDGPDEPIEAQLYFNDRISLTFEGVEYVSSGNFHDTSLSALRKDISSS